MKPGNKIQERACLKLMALSKPLSVHKQLPKQVRHRLPWLWSEGLVCQGPMDPWALQSHSINASLDQLFKPLSSHVMCLVKGETDAGQFPKRGKKKQLEKVADRQ